MGNGTARVASARRQDGTGMWRLIKAVVVLCVLAAVALTAFAYVGPILFPDEFAPPVRDVTLPVTLEGE